MSWVHAISMLALVVCINAAAIRIEQAIDRNTYATENMFNIPPCKLEVK